MDDDERRTHLQKVLERMQQQQREGLIQPPEQLRSPSSPPQNTNSPETLDQLGVPLNKEIYSRYDSSNNNPQDEVLDYSKSSSCKKRLLVPTYQTSIFSGEFRNAAELQDFERLLELRYTKRKGKLDIAMNQNTFK